MFSTCSHRCFRLVLLCGLLILAGCASRTPQMDDSAPQSATPLRVMTPLEESGVFLLGDEDVQRLIEAMNPTHQNMKSWTEMRFAVQQSLAHARAKNPGQIALERPGFVVTYGEMAKSLERFQELLPRLDKEPELLAQSFTWLRVGPDFRFTGYFEPTLPASPVRTARFTHPLYAAPPDLNKESRRKLYSRKGIDNKGLLRNKGLEIAWIEHAADAFILQIQGSGRLVFPDGSIRYALYAAQNGHKYYPIGRALRDKGILQPDEISMDRIRDWLVNNPDRQHEIMNLNPSYVFFRLGDKGSYGSMGRILSPWVSAAVDQNVLPNGLLTFMSVPLPQSNGKSARPFHALMLPQDSGGAIKQNRVDLFCGNGDEGERVASNMKNQGAVVILLPRETKAFAKAHPRTGKIEPVEMAAAPKAPTLLATASVLETKAPATKAKASTVQAKAPTSKTKASTVQTKAPATKNKTSAVQAKTAATKTKAAEAKSKTSTTKAKAPAAQPKKSGAQPKRVAAR